MLQLPFCVLTVWEFVTWFSKAGARNLHHCSNVTVVVYLPSSWLSYLWFNCSWVRLGTSELSVKSMQYFPAWSEQTFVVETFVRQKSASIWRVDWWTALPQNACLTPGQLQWRMRGVLILLPQYLNFRPSFRKNWSWYYSVYKFMFSFHIMVLQGHVL